MLKRIIFITALFGVLQTRAQIDFNQYTPAQCQGEIPADLTADAKLLYEQKALRIEDSDKGKRRQNDEKEFYLQNNFSIQDFLVSGQILYNDTFTRYIEKIADVLLKDNPKLRKKLRFYTVKSPEVNAFATQEGIVFVNVGLISSVKNEAQLAYVLAHEISHYTEGHVLQGFLETRRIVRGEGQYRYQDYYSRLRSFFRYSRDSEYEADEKGWEIFSKSPYAKGVVTSVFDMLLYAHIHYDSIPFHPNYFGEKDYQFPKDYYKDSVDALYLDDNHEDNFSTHPNVKDRKKRTIELIDSDSVGGNPFVVSEADFHSLQRIARYEMLRYYISNTNFADAYYHALLIENTYEAGEYIDFMKGMAMYGLAKHFNNRGKRRNIILPYKDVQSTPQRFYYFLHQLSTKEMTILALRENTLLQKKYPNSKFFKMVQEDLMKLLIVENKFRPEDFYTKWKDMEISERTTKEEKNYYRFAFVDFFNDPLFYQKLQGFETYRDEGNEFFQKEKYSKSMALEKGKLKDLEITELSLFQPSFQVITEGLTEMPKVDYLKGLEEQNYLITLLADLAKTNGLQVEYIEQKPQDYTTAQYNAFSSYMNWLMERTNNNMKMVYHQNKNVVDSSATNHVGIIEIQSVVKNFLIKKFYYWEYNFLVYDKTTGQLVFYQSLQTNKKYKRKKVKKTLSNSIKSIVTNYPSEDED